MKNEMKGKCSIDIGNVYVKRQIINTSLMCKLWLHLPDYAQIGS